VERYVAKALNHLLREDTPPTEEAPLKKDINPATVYSGAIHRRPPLLAALPAQCRNARKNYFAIIF